MASEVSMRLSEFDYHVASEMDESIPLELTPDISTEEGVLFVTIDSDEITENNLFEAVGKSVTLKQFLQNHQMFKYSVVLLLSHEQFKQIGKQMRAALNDEVNLMII